MTGTASVLQDKVLQTDGGDGRCNAGAPGQVPAPGIVQKNRQGGPAGATCRLLLTARKASAAVGRVGTAGEGTGPGQATCYPLAGGATAFLGRLEPHVLLGSRSR